MFVDIFKIAGELNRLVPGSDSVNRFIPRWRRGRAAEVASGGYIASELGKDASQV
jgi:hypothetical protein